MNHLRNDTAYQRARLHLAEQAKIYNDAVAYAEQCSVAGPEWTQSGALGAERQLALATGAYSDALLECSQIMNDFHARNKCEALVPGILNRQIRG